MNSFVAILIGFSMGMLKVFVEYDLWGSKKGVPHGLGALIVGIILGFIYYVSGYNWKFTTITWLSYWNSFEWFNNYFHNQEIFYVGETARFDKFLRWLASAKWLIKFSFDESRIKFVLHLITIVIILILYNK